MGMVVLFYIVACSLVSLLTFGLYGWDKWQARRGGRRVPEATLHLLGFLGGWPGGWLGQRTFRHKTCKPSFQLVFWSLVALHLLLAGGLGYGVQRLTGNADLPASSRLTGAGAGDAP